MALITGDNNDNNLIGTSGVDTIQGLGGNDVLNGGLGADALDGGTGFDFASYKDATAGLTVSLLVPGNNTGEAAGDTFIAIEGLIGSKFDDSLTGDAGDNILRGGLGADHLDGGAGFDYADYKGAAAAVTVSLATPASNTGEAAGDTYVSIEAIRGSDFSDTLTGDAHDNVLRGGLGADHLDGGAGFDFADYRNATAAVTVSLINPASNTGEAAGDAFVSIEGLIGSNFSDTLTGDANGNILRGGLGADHLDGGAGFDFADYKNSTAGLTVSLANPASNTGEAVGDTYVSIEGISGSDFDDTLIGDANGNFLRGGLGADHLDGGAGFDYADYYNSSTGLTVSLANPAANTGEAAGDTYTSIEALQGSAFSDTLIGDANGNFLRGGLGADHLDGGAGFDYADYKGSTAGLTVSLATPANNTGEAAGDTYISIEALQGSNFNDTLIGDANDNFLRGGLGADHLDGGSAGLDFADYYGSAAGLTASLASPAANTGEAAGDTYTSIEGLQGTQFADTLIGDAQNNILRGRGGADILNGGDGTDFADYTGSTAGLTASLANPASNTGDAAGDTYISIEGLRGTDFDDTLIGGNGRYDFLNGGLGADTLKGGTGFDWADYSRSSAGLTVNLANPAANTGEAAGDTFSSIENIRGSDFDDTLIGDANNNYLRGGLGADHLDGGAGIDVADYRGATSGITVSLANPSSNTGEAIGDTYTRIEGLGGSDFADHLIGDAGNNILLGRAGADILDGGSAGSDTAIYDYGDVATGVTASLLTPASNKGDAAGDSYISIENLSGTDPFGDTLIGDNGANRLSGLGGDDTLQGNGGADILDGGDGNDTASYAEKTTSVVVTLNGATVMNVTVGGAVEDKISNIENIIGGSAADTLTGDSQNNTFQGMGGNDILNGKEGTDTMTGGAGDDFYYVDNAGDRVFESAGGGNDRVYTSVTYALAAGQEIETLVTTLATATTAINLTGNEFAQTIVANAGANIIDGKGGVDLMYGMGGNDFYYVDNSADRVFESVSGGNDRVYTSVSYALGAGQEIETFLTTLPTATTAINMTGNEFAQSITGNAGANIIDGKGGIDQMYGLGGNDFYYVDNASDRVFESVGGGNDRVYASASYALGAGQEIETFVTTSSAATTAINLTGNEFAQTIVGNAGANIIDGKAGNDLLYGSGGNDRFVFDTALNASTNVDRIFDFISSTGAAGNVDKIALDDAVFTTLNPTHAATPFALSAATFTTAAPLTPDQHIIYNPTSGALSYDDDGSGAHTAIQFAVLTTHPALTNADFIVV